MIPKKVLVAPLDWGLGHATRCIPIIRELQKQNCEVHIGGAGKSLQLLQLEFPELKSHDFPSYSPVYPKSGSMVWKLLLQVPKFLKAIRSEKIVVDKIIEHEGIDFVIADNRYGAWSDKVPSVFITHQLNILLPRGLGWMKPFLRNLNYTLIKKFLACWVPDLPSRELSGELSLPFKNLKTEYIGFLSRFTRPTVRAKKFDILALLSGPEPQRTLFEDILFDQLANFNLKVLVVRGIVGENNDRYSHANIEVVNAMVGEELQSAIESSGIVIARSGYSTIMDMTVFQSTCIFVPTPGQTEQVYLAKELVKKRIAYSCDQRVFNLNDALMKARTFIKPFPLNDTSLLSDAITNLLKT